MFKWYYFKKQIDKWIDNSASWFMKLSAVCVSAGLLSIFLKVIGVLPHTSWWIVLSPLLFWYTFFFLFASSLVIYDKLCMPKDNTVIKYKKEEPDKK